MQDQQVRKRQYQGRSPGYPAIDLQEAMDKAATLRKYETTHYAPVEGILRHWDYGPGSSKGLLALAALKKYGLVDYDGSGAKRKARISDLANRILIDDRHDSREREKLVEEAALKPKIHKELRERYPGEIPSDTNIEFYLKGERGFTDHAAKKLAKIYRRTIDFAKLTKHDNMLPDEVETMDSPESEETMPLSSANRDEAKETRMPRGFGFPISPTGWATIQISEEWEEDTFTRIINTLKHYKSTLYPKQEGTGKESSGKNNSSDD